MRCARSGNAVVGDACVPYGAVVYVWRVASVGGIEQGGCVVYRRDRVCSSCLPLFVLAQPPPKPIAHALSLTPLHDRSASSFRSKNLLVLGSK